MRGLLSEQMKKSKKNASKRVKRPTPALTQGSKAKIKQGVTTPEEMLEWPDTKKLKEAMPCPQ
jgi:hypothetical protein